jgi:hypothetical protein
MLGGPDTLSGMPKKNIEWNKHKKNGRIEETLKKRIQQFKRLENTNQKTRNQKTRNSKREDCLPLAD